MQPQAYNPWTQPMYAPAPRSSLAPVSPLVAISRSVRPAAVRGVGFDAPDVSGISAATGLVLLGLSAALSYYAGAAMTPGGSKKTTWGLVGIPVGLLTGPIGLGVMGIIAMKK